MAMRGSGRKNKKVPEAERILIHVPIVHAPADMGRHGESLRRLTFQKSGLQGWRRKVEQIERMWAETERTLDGWRLDYRKVRLYQDGLPVCGREAEIVTELAGSGSPNHRLLLRLMEKGAALMGTESAELLMQEYALAKKILEAKDAEEASAVEAGHKGLSDSLLIARDQFIASRIQNTLLPGETGILFLGLLHCPGSWLDPSIRVLHPFHSGPDGRGR